MAEEQIDNSQAEAAPKEETVAAGEKKGLMGLIKLPLLIAIVAVLAVGSALVITKVAKGDSAKAESEKAAKEEPAKKELGKFISFESFTVNLSGGTNYLQAALAFEVKAEIPELEKEVEERKPQINDLIITILSSKTIEDIDDVSEREKLKNDIKKAVDSLLSYGKIERVYFTTFIMQ